MEQAVSVNSIREEYDYIRAHPCECGGAWDRQRQALIFSDEKIPFDQISVKCHSCARDGEFWFNCSTFFGKPAWE